MVVLLSISDLSKLSNHLIDRRAKVCKLIFFLLNNFGDHQILIVGCYQIDFVGCYRIVVGY